MVQQEFEEGSEVDLEAIRARLQSRNESDRETGAAMMSRLTVSDLVRLCEIERRGRLRRRRTLAAGIVFYAVLTILIMIFAHSVQMIVYVGSFTGVIAGMMAFSEPHKRAAVALSSVDSLDAVGSLVEALEMPDEQVRRPVGESLTRLLPRLHNSDYDRLNGVQRRILRNLLGKQAAQFASDPAMARLVTATLQALRQVGDDSFAESVTRLAEGEGVGKLEEVRTAARECLPYLHQAQESARIRHDLLRPSSATSLSGQDVLLRPAEHASSVQPAELLRPIDE